MYRGIFGPILLKFNIYNRKQSCKSVTTALKRLSIHADIAAVDVFIILDIIPILEIKSIVFIEQKI